MPMMVLFQPPGACRAFTRSGSVYPPLGLCQLAAVVGPQGAVVVDADGEDLDADVALQRVAELAPLAVGMTATSYTLELVETWAARFRSLGLRVIVGGPHASLAPVDLLDRCPSVEAVVRGEGEEAMPALVDALEAGLPWPDCLAWSLGSQDDRFRAFYARRTWAPCPCPPTRACPLRPTGARMRVAGPW